MLPIHGSPQTIANLVDRRFFRYENATGIEAQACLAEGLPQSSPETHDLLLDRRPAHSLTQTSACTGVGSMPPCKRIGAQASGNLRSMLSEMFVPGQKIESQHKAN